MCVHTVVNLLIHEYDVYMYIVYTYIVHVSVYVYIWQNVYAFLYRQLVRKKAVMAMHRFFLLSPESVGHLEDDFRRSLSDQDPGVMEASLILFHDLIKVFIKPGAKIILS